MSTTDNEVLFCMLRHSPIIWFENFTIIEVIRLQIRDSWKNVRMDPMKKFVRCVVIGKTGSFFARFWTKIRSLIMIIWPFLLVYTSLKENELPNDDNLREWWSSKKSSKKIISRYFVASREQIIGPSLSPCNGNQC